MPDPRCLALAALIASATRAEPIRLHGAASVVDGVIQPHKQEVERATWLSLATGCPCSSVVVASLPSCGPTGTC